MAIINYTGVPGSGKSYRVVYELLRKGAANKYYVLHNIDGLRAELFERPDLVKDWRLVFSEGVGEWVTKGGFARLAQECKERFERPLLLIFDEAQMIFDMPNKQFKEALSWHRHEGIDIWLICQHASMINPQYRKLCDYEVQAKKCFAVPHFIYRYKVQGVSFRTEKLKKDAAVFACFNSFNVAEANKGGSRLLVGLPVLLGVGALLFIWVLYKTPATFAAVVGNKLDSAGVVKVDSVKIKKAVHGTDGDRAGQVRKAADRLIIASRFGDKVSVWNDGRIVSLGVLRGAYRILEDKPEYIVVHVLGKGVESLLKRGRSEQKDEKEKDVTAKSIFTNKSK